MKKIYLIEGKALNSAFNTSFGKIQFANGAAEVEDGAFDELMNTPNITGKSFFCIDEPVRKPIPVQPSRHTILHPSNTAATMRLAGGVVIQFDEKGYATIATKDLQTAITSGCKLVKTAEIATAVPETVSDIAEETPTKEDAQVYTAKEEVLPSPKRGRPAKT